MNSFLSMQNYISLWQTEINNGNRNILYVDIPYCEQLCKYCIYNPFLLNNEIQVEQYLDKVLLSDLKNYSNILNQIPFDEIFFGGGTPSLLVVPQIKRIINAIPQFEKIKVKAFEAHPHTMPSDKLETLIDMGFNYFTFGIQTFDKSILKKQNRVYVSPSKMETLINMIRKVGGVSSIDLIAYLDSRNSQEIHITQNDIKILSTKVRPDIIVVHTNYKNYNGSKIEQLSLNKVVLEAILTSEYYTKVPEVFTNPSILKELDPYAYSMYLGDFSKIASHKLYDCSGPGFLNPRQNVLVAGGTESRKLYSYIGGKYQWYIWHNDMNEVVINQTPYNYCERTSKVI